MSDQGEALDSFTIDSASQSSIEQEDTLPAIEELGELIRESEVALQQLSTLSTPSAPSVSSTPSVAQVSIMSSTTPPKQPPTPKIEKVNINGVEFEVNVAVDLNKVEAPTALYSLATRAALLVDTDATEKLHNAVTNFRKGAATKIGLINPSVDSSAALKDTASLMQLVQSMETHLGNYDANGVFHIISHDPTDLKVIKSEGNLYEDHGKITKEQVGASNLYY